MFEQKIKIYSLFFLIMFFASIASGCGFYKNNGSIDENAYNVVEKEGVDNDEGLISVQLIAGGEKYKMNIESGSSVIDLMERLSQTADFSFSAKEYEGMGSMVEEINGLKNKLDENKFWFLYVNGEISNVGASDYILKEGDKITWKYEESQF